MNETRGNRVSLFRPGRRRNTVGLSNTDGCILEFYIRAPLCILPSPFPSHRSSARPEAARCILSDGWMRNTHRRTRTSTCIRSNGYTADDSSAGSQHKPVRAHTHRWPHRNTAYTAYQWRCTLCFYSCGPHLNAIRSGRWEQASADGRCQGETGNQ